MNPPDLSRENRKIIKNWSADFSRALPRVLCGGKTLKIPSPLNWWILEVWIDDLFAKGYAEGFLQALEWWTRPDNEIQMPMDYREYADKSTMLLLYYPDKAHGLKQPLIQFWGTLMTRAKPEIVYRAGYGFCQVFLPNLLERDHWCCAVEFQSTKD